MKKNNRFNGMDIINLALIGVNLGLIFYVGYLSFLKTDPRLDMISGEMISSGAPLPQSEVALAKKPSFSLYKREFRNRNIFEGFAPDEKPQSVVKPKIVEPVKVDTTIEEIKRYYQVLGILLDDSPKVLIKDWRNNETLILSVGEKIEKAVLKEIFEDKIILEYGDEQIEMVP